MKVCKACSRSMPENSVGNVCDDCQDKNTRLQEMKERRKREFMLQGLGLTKHVTNGGEIIWS